MDPELLTKKSPVVRRELVTAVMPKPVGTHLVRGRTKAAVLREVGRLSRKGYVAGASELAEFHSRAGGGYGVKIALAKPLPQPMPGWAKGCALVGSVMMACSVVGLFVVNALASMFTAAAAVPWEVVGGVFAVVVIALLVAKRLIFGGGISIIQSVRIK